MSRRGKSVSFPLYSQDWLTDERVALLSDASARCYIELLCRAHLEGGIPIDPAQIRVLLRRGPEEWPAIWAELEGFWPLVGDRRQNPKMARILADQAAYREWQAAKGRASAAARASATAGATAVEPRLNPRASATGQQPARKEKETSYSERAGVVILHESCNPPPSPPCSAEAAIPGLAPATPAPPRPPKGGGVGRRNAAHRRRAPSRQREETDGDRPGEVSGLQPRTEATGDHAEAIRWWCSEWERTRLGQAYVVEAGKDGAAVARMLRRAPLTEVQVRMTRLLESDDRWIAENASLALCASRWNQLAVVVPRGRNGRAPDYLDLLLRGQEVPGE